MKRKESNSNSNIKKCISLLKEAQQLAPNQYNEDIKNLIDEIDNYNVLKKDTKKLKRSSKQEGSNNNKNKELCNDCHLVIKFGGGYYCLDCRIKNNQMEFMKDPYSYKWEEANTQFITHFIINLARLYHYCRAFENICNIITIKKILGLEIYENHYKIINELLRFAKEEEDKFGFACSGIKVEVSLCRFEKRFKNNKSIMDFWLTLCCCYDLGNYLTDLVELQNGLI